MIDYRQQEEAEQERMERTIDCLVSAKVLGLSKDKLSWLAFECGIGKEWDQEVNRRGWS